MQAVVRYLHQANNPDRRPCPGVTVPFPRFHALTAHGHESPHYKWVALSNTTLGVLMATINSSIVLISLPAIFRGIHLDPLLPSNASYLLWMLMGFLLVSAVLVVSLGRLGDMYGRVKMYNAGFAVFTIGAIACALVPFDGSAGALWLIGMRLVQGVGAAMLMANSTAILTDAFPAKQPGFAPGINNATRISGSASTCSAASRARSWALSSVGCLPRSTGG